MQRQPHQVCLQVYISSDVWRVTAVLHTEGIEKKNNESKNLFR